MERAHLLQDVIAALEADGNAFARRTLHYQLKANDKLLAKIREHQKDHPDPHADGAGNGAAEGGAAAPSPRRRHRSPARR